MDHWQYYLRGRFLETFGRRAAAVDAYREALRIAPAFTRAANRAAYLLASLEQYDEAERHFRLALRSDPGNAVTHFNLGYTLDKHGRHGDAVAEFLEATRLRPGLDRAWYGLGLSHAALGQHKEAAAALQEASTLQPMNPHAWYALGMAHHSLGDAAKLKQVALHLLRFDPKMTRRLVQDSGATELSHLVKDLMV
jgi:tetratricopeptide (TPR) repeat protein